MSAFTDDMRAIEKWGQSVSQAIQKGLPLPDLILPSNRILNAREVEANPSPAQNVVSASPI
jgi:hypothetical protein